jgi:hypothetical protein
MSEFNLDLIFSKITNLKQLLILHLLDFNIDNPNIDPNIRFEFALYQDGYLHENMDLNLSEILSDEHFVEILHMCLQGVNKYINSDSNYKDGKLIAINSRFDRFIELYMSNKNVLISYIKQIYNTSFENFANECIADNDELDVDEKNAIYAERYTWDDSVLMKFYDIK